MDFPTGSDLKFRIGQGEIRFWLGGILVNVWVEGREMRSKLPMVKYGDKAFGPARQLQPHSHHTFITYTTTTP